MILNRHQADTADDEYIVNHFSVKDMQDQERARQAARREGDQYAKGFVRGVSDASRDRKAKLKI